MVCWLDMGVNLSWWANFGKIALIRGVDWSVRVRVRWVNGQLGLGLGVRMVS